MFVVDASVTLAWSFADENSDLADRVLERFREESAIAPSIWPLEVANGLRTAERRGRLELAAQARIRELLSALPIQIEPIELGAALGEITEVARRLDLTAYDAAYLSLAARRGVALATIDDRLRQASRRAGVELIE